MDAWHNRFTVLGDNKQIGEGETTQTHRLPSNHSTFNKILTKTYFKLIQATHHMRIVEHSLHTNSHPAGMYRQVNKLTHFIKPPSPNDTTTQKISKNTLTWMNNNMLILQ